MAYTRRDIRGGAVATTLSGGMNSGDASFAIAATAGWPDGSAGDFFVVIDRGTATEEKIRCASRTSGTVTVQTSGRGADGTNAAAHSSGAAVEHIITAIDADEANYTVSKTVAKVTNVGDLLVGDAVNSLTRLGLGTTGLPLVAGGTTPAYSALGTTGIADNAVTSPKIATDAVGASQIAAGAVGTSELATGAVTTAAIAAGAVTTTEILDGTIAAADIAAGAVTTAKLAAGAVTANELGTGAVTSAKILDGTIATADIAAGAITSALILDGTIATADFAAGAVDTAALGTSSVTQAKMVSEAGTAWTPTIAGTGWAIGNGTVSGQYLKFGRLTFVAARITFGTTSTFGSGAMTVGGLSTANNSGILATGMGRLHDTSANDDYPCHWYVAVNGTGGEVRAFGQFAAPGFVVSNYQLGTTQPFAWASTDFIELSMMYIAAS